LVGYQLDSVNNCVVAIVVQCCPTSLDTGLCA
jgi:hypothetical protein